MYKVEFTESAVKQLKKLDKQTVRVIKNWVIKNLVNTPDPRLHGKALKGNLKGIWRYRVGDYRLFASIEACFFEHTCCQKINKNLQFIDFVLLC